jgi:Trypsin-co-occurring domain 2
MGQEGWVGLADAVRALRSELTAAMAEAEGQRLRFELDAVEMEFLLEVRKEGGAEAGVKFYVISLGAKGGVSSGSTHRVKLSLSPKDMVTGRKAQIADEVEAQRPAPG